MPPSPPDILTICYLCDDAGIDFTLTRVGYDFLLPEHRWVCRIGNDAHFMRGFGTDASAAVEDAYQRALAAAVLPPQAIPQSEDHTMADPSLYTVARSDGENREYNLTLTEAAQMILHHDGADYKIRPASDGEGFWLYTRAHRNFPWVHAFFSAYSDGYVAEADIFKQVVDKSALDGWLGLVAEEQSSYCARAMLERMRSDCDPVDDADQIAGIDAKIAEIEG